MADHREEGPDVHYEEGGMPDTDDLVEEMHNITIDEEGFVLEETIPTQVLEPKQSVNRTVLQTLIPSLLLMVGIVPLILQEILNGMGEVLPASVRLWLAGAAVAMTAVAGTLAKVMALPAVNSWLVRRWPSMAASKNEE